jgi:hypothetical protein
MSVDTRGQAAAEGLWAAEPAVDTDEMLAGLHRTRRSRNRRNVAVVAAAAVAIAVLAGATIGHDQKASPPVITPPHPAPSVAVRPCLPQTPDVSCAGPIRFRIALPVALTAELPRTFWRGISVEPERARTFFRRLNAPDMTGVYVLENAVVVRPDRHQDPGVATYVSPDPTVGRTARAVYQWLTSRPYLYVFDAGPTALAGYPAYQVEFASNGGAHSTGADRPAYTPVFGTLEPRQQDFIGNDVGMKVRCWLLDVPGAGLTVIWSQTWGDPAALDRNDQLVYGLQFEP